MTQREKILVGVIAALALVAAVGFTTHFGSIENPLTSQTQNEKSAAQTLNAQTQQPKLEYAAINIDSQNSQNTLTVLFKKVENSVVQITTKVSTVNTNIIVNGAPLESESSRLGSGFVYDTQGHIITNNHVVDGAQVVDVRFIDGNVYSAKVIGTDPFNDIAV